MEQSILCKEGYLIPKNNKYKNQIELLKKELNVEPYTFFKNNTNIKFNVYQENENYYCIPKFYGLKNFGKPDINKEIIGSEINIKFNGENLRYIGSFFIKFVSIFILIFRLFSLSSPLSSPLFNSE